MLGVKALSELSSAEFRRRAFELSPEIARRCRFILEENDRVVALAEALPAGDHGRIARLSADSFAGAMTLYEIGTPAMEAMMQGMLAAPGVIGARQAGAGFGGCMVAFVDAARVEAFGKAVRESYSAATGKEADVYAVAAGPGAGLLK